MIEKKLIKIHWIAPNGKHYQDDIPMTIEQYTDFVNILLKLKNSNDGFTRLNEI